MTCDCALFQVTYWLVHDVWLFVVSGDLRDCLLFQVTDAVVEAHLATTINTYKAIEEANRRITAQKREEAEETTALVWELNAKAKACTVCKHHFLGLTMLIPPHPSPKAVTAKWWGMLVRIGVPFTTTLNRITIVSCKAYLNLLNTWMDLSHPLQQERNIFKDSRRINRTTLKCSLLKFYNQRKTVTLAHVVASVCLVGFFGVMFSGFFGVHSSFMNVGILLLMCF